MSSLLHDSVYIAIIFACNLTTENKNVKQTLHVSLLELVVNTFSFV